MELELLPIPPPGSHTSLDHPGQLHPGRSREERYVENRHYPGPQPGRSREEGYAEAPSCEPWRRHHSAPNREIAPPCKLPATFADFYFKNLDSAPTLLQDSQPFMAMPTPAAHLPVIDLSKDTDDYEDSLPEDNATDSPRAIICGNACQLDDMISRRAGMFTELQPTSVGPNDDAMRGLSDFVDNADDTVLTYLLEKADEHKE